MRSQSGTKQTPKAFHGVDVYFVDTVSISVAGVLALTVMVSQGKAGNTTLCSWPVRGFRMVSSWSQPPAGLRAERLGDVKGRAHAVGHASLLTFLSHAFQGLEVGGIRRWKPPGAS